MARVRSRDEASDAKGKGPTEEKVKARDEFGELY